jgi:hypothetical protein
MNEKTKLRIEAASRLMPLFKPASGFPQTGSNGDELIVYTKMAISLADTIIDEVEKNERSSSIKRKVVRNKNKIRK